MPIVIGSSSLRSGCMTRWMLYSRTATKERRALAEGSQASAADRQVPVASRPGRRRGVLVVVLDADRRSRWQAGRILLFAAQGHAIVGLDSASRAEILSC